jgi:hypothetical protein
VTVATRAVRVLIADDQTLFRAGWGATAWRRS